MVLAKVVHKGSFSDAYNFIKDFRSWKECEEIFGDDIKEISDCKGDDNEKILALFEHLISLAWCDEELIEHFLARDKKKWFLKYVDDRNNGYFDLYEVKE